MKLNYRLVVSVTIPTFCWRCTTEDNQTCCNCHQLHNQKKRFLSLKLCEQHFCIMVVPVISDATTNHLYGCSCHQWCDHQPFLNCRLSTFSLSFDVSAYKFPLPKEKYMRSSTFCKGVSLQRSIIWSVNLIHFDLRFDEDHTHARWSLRHRRLETWNWLCKIYWLRLSTAFESE